MRKLDITGERYGRLVAVARVPSKDRHTKWSFHCDCGETTVAHLDAVRSGATTSCGCVRKEVTRERSITHGHHVNRTRSRTYAAWQHAKERCFNPNIERYPQYGGRGITMCAAWAESFEAFLRDMGECPPGMSIDRYPNVDGNYEKGNCRWATAAQQARTRTDSVLVEHDGEMLVLKDFAAKVGVNYKTLHNRMRSRGETADQAARHLMLGAARPAPPPAPPERPPPA